MAIIHLTSENFENEAVKSDKPVLIDFWAPWCGPCRMIAPVIEEIAAERDDIKVAKVNVDEAGELAAQFGVMSIPTIIVMVNGEVKTTSVGFKPKAALLALLD